MKNFESFSYNSTLRLRFIYIYIYIYFQDGIVKKKNIKGFNQETTSKLYVVELNKF